MNEAKPSTPSTRMSARRRTLRMRRPFCLRACFLLRRNRKGRSLVARPVMPSRSWVASTKPEGALDRGQGSQPWQGRGCTLAPRDRGPGPDMYCRERHYTRRMSLAGLTPKPGAVLPEGALEEKLKLGRPLRVKLGIDVTAPDVTLGNGVPL